MTSENGYITDLVKVSSNYINSIGNPSLLSLKVFLMGLIKLEDRDIESTGLLDKTMYKRIEQQTGTDYSKGLVAQIRNDELRRIMNNKSGSYYSAVEKLLSPNTTDPNTLRNNLVFMAPDDSGMLGYTELITGCCYDKDSGCMFIKFNGEESVRRELLNLKKNYSLLPTKFMMTVKSIYTYKIYALIEDRIGKEDFLRKRKNLPPAKEYNFEFQFGELKFLLGIFDIAKDAKIRKALSSSKKVDFNKLAEELEKNGEGAVTRKYSELKRYALNKAEKEINEREDSEYIIKFSSVGNGRGNKTVAVIVNVKRKFGATDVIDKKELSDEEKLNFVDSLRNTVIGNLPLVDLMSIANVAEYSMSKINKAITIMENSGKTINSPTGFIIDAIKNDWNTNAKIEKTTDFGNFEQRDYDFADLENKLLNQ